MIVDARIAPKNEGLFTRLFHELAQTLRDAQARSRVARAHRAEYEKIIRELGRYTDRELADIRISRLEIRDIARDHADRKLGVRSSA